ncbi:hypothetical protein [Streptomyces chartreusis]
MATTLTLEDVHALWESALRSGYWAECVAYPPDHNRVFWLGARPAGSPRLALRWLRSRAQDIAGQLDPTAAPQLEAWLLDTAAHQRALSALCQGEMVWRAVVDGEGIRYVFSARPVHTVALRGTC